MLPPGSTDKSPRAHQSAHYQALQSLKLRRHSSGDDALCTLSASNGGESATAWPSPNDVGQPANGADLHDKVASLEALVVAQRDMLVRQQAALDQLQQRAEISQSRPGLARTTTAGPSGSSVRPFDAQRRAGYGDRRYLGLYDARFHSTASYVGHRCIYTLVHACTRLYTHAPLRGATPRDFRIVPRKIILVRHGESMGNVDHHHYTYVPDPQVPLVRDSCTMYDNRKIIVARVRMPRNVAITMVPRQSEQGYNQAITAGEQIRQLMDADGLPYKLFFYYSPYLRSKQTFEGIVSAFDDEQIAGAQEEVQIREQDFGNFQDASAKEKEKAERLRFGRFFYRFPNGESGADVYDRITIFEDHMIRDINAGRFSNDTSLVLVTHGLATRVFLMRWFHWTVDQFLKVYNPPNAAPIVLERVPKEHECYPGGPASWMHTKVR